MTLLVSVVMAAYNAESTIEEAIESVVAQTHRDWELLVVDDGSTDGTADRVEGFGDGRIRLLGRPHVGVLGAVRNEGIAEAAGDAVALLDADDVWRPRKLEAQVECLVERPEVGVVHTAADLLEDGVVSEGPRPAVPRDLVPALLANNFVTSSSAVVRASLLREHGAFDPDPALGGAPDYELWLRLAPHTQFAYLAEPLVLYRMHAAQMSAAHTAMQQANLVVLGKFAAANRRLAAHERTALRAARGMREQLAGEPGRGRRDLLFALTRRPWSAFAWRWLARSFVRRA